MMGYADKTGACTAASGVFNSLSTLETIVADFGDNLSPKKGDCRRQSSFSATVAEIGDSPVWTLDRA